MADETDLYVVFDGPPGPESGRFVEVEDANRRSVDASPSSWEQRDDGYWTLGPFRSVPVRADVMTEAPHVYERDGATIIEFDPPAEAKQPGDIIADEFTFGSATGAGAVAALEAAGWRVERADNADERDRALSGALDYLRNIPHEVLDQRYEVDSMYRDLMEAIGPLGRLHAIVAIHETTDMGNLGPQIRDEVLAPSRRIVEHWTDGPPDFVSERDAG